MEHWTVRQCGLMFYCPTSRLGSVEASTPAEKAVAVFRLKIIREIDAWPFAPGKKGHPFALLNLPRLPRYGRNDNELPLDDRLPEDFLDASDGIVLVGASARENMDLSGRIAARNYGPLNLR